jgi:hypothetical protein
VPSTSLPKKRNYENVLFKPYAGGTGMDWARFAALLFQPRLATAIIVPHFSQPFFSLEVDSENLACSAGGQRKQRVSLFNEPGTGLASKLQIFF